MWGGGGVGGVFFFFNDTATTEIYTLSLHDALPISLLHAESHGERVCIRPQIDIVCSLNHTMYHVYNP